MRAELVGAVLTGADLGTARFEDADLTGADLTRTKLFVADFETAGLRKAILTEASAVEARFTGADLSDAVLRRADLAGARLRGAKLDGADLVRARLTDGDHAGASFEAARLADATFLRSDLAAARFRDADLDGTELRDASLRDADLRGADLAGSDLREADLRGADLGTARNLASARFSRLSVYDDVTRFPSGFDPVAASLTTFPSRSTCRIGVRAVGAFGRVFFLDQSGTGRWNRSADRRVRLRPFGEPALVGDWDGDGADDIGKASGDEFLLDLDGNLLFDATVDTRFDLAPGRPGTPVVGDWNGDGQDEVGRFSAADSTFLLDANGDRRWTPSQGDRASQFRPVATPGVPLVGDWDGDGSHEIGVFASRTFYLDLNDDGVWSGRGVDAAVELAPSALDPVVPLVCDWNRDGTDDLGLVSTGSSKYFIDLNGDRRWTPAAGNRATFFAPGLSDPQPVAGFWAGPSPDL